MQPTRDLAYRKHLAFLYTPKHFDRVANKNLHIACYYCGSIATQRDHVPPLKLIRNLINTNQYEIAVRCDLFIVPACKPCNLTLGARPLFTLAKRREYIWSNNSKAPWRCFRVSIYNCWRKISSVTFSP